MKNLLTLLSLFSIGTAVAEPVPEAPAEKSSHVSHGFKDAASYGFLPEASGAANTKALQDAVDQGGTIVVSQPGTYRLAGTVYLGSNTSLKFGDGVFLKKVRYQGAFSHVLLNKGALTKNYNEHISVDGLQIIVNGVDACPFKDVYGLRGHLAFFYVKDLRITGFRCLDVGSNQYCIHVCTFEDLLIDDVIIKGLKDGIHLGRGKRFTIRNGVFQTADDAVALNAHDYATGNPELGWIEDGLVENCRDLDQPPYKIAFFCRFLAGAWTDWKPGMKVQQSDTVVSSNRLYRVQLKPDGVIHTSLNPPTHPKGAVVLDGINWGVVQDDVTYTAGVRNVTFRDIFLEKPRTAFSVHFDNCKASRSYYPGSEIPKQEGIVLEDIRILYPERTEFLHIATPIDSITVMNSSFRNNFINFVGVNALADAGTTILNFMGCSYLNPGKTGFLINTAPKKTIVLKTSASSILNEDFSATLTPGNAVVKVDSDLPGLSLSSAPKP